MKELGEVDLWYGDMMGAWSMLSCEVVILKRFTSLYKYVEFVGSNVMYHSSVQCFEQLTKRSMKKYDGVTHKG